MASKRQLEKFVDRVYKKLDKGFETGLSVAVVTKDKVLLSKGYGYKNRANKTRVNANTLFALGSVTKPFTSLAVMMSIEKGMAQLSKPVRYYDDNYALMDPSPRQRPRSKTFSPNVAVSLEMTASGISVVCRCRTSTRCSSTSYPTRNQCRVFETGSTTTTSCTRRRGYCSRRSRRRAGRVS